MSYQTIVISSGHGKKVGGASGYLVEVPEARRMVENVAEKLRARGVIVDVFHDDTSTDAEDEFEYDRQLPQFPVATYSTYRFHLNAYVETDNPMGS